MPYRSEYRQWVDDIKSPPPSHRLAAVLVVFTVCVIVWAPAIYLLVRWFL